MVKDEGPARRNEPDHTGRVDDRFLPGYDVAARYDTLVQASAAATFRALVGIDMARSRVVRTLFFLRGMSRGPFTLEQIERGGFVRLLESPPEHLAFGLVGKFWTPTGGLLSFEPNEFAPFAEPGYAKALWTFTITDVGGASGATSRLETETRVQCTDAVSRRRFLRYWNLVGPFSAWTRREILRLVAEAAEGRSTA